MISRAGSLTPFIATIVFSAMATKHLLTNELIKPCDKQNPVKTTAVNLLVHMKRIFIFPLQRRTELLLPSRVVFGLAAYFVSVRLNRCVVQKEYWHMLILE